MARVSIGLPVYNGENFLRAAIESVLTQTYSDWELIISDNCSTDSTPDICQEYAAEDDRIRFFPQKENLGAAPNFNFTFAEATGTYFQWLAHDDYLKPDWLTRCVEALDGDDHAQLVYGQQIDVDPEGVEIRKRPYLQPNERPTPWERLAAILSNDRGSPAIFGLMRRDVLEQTGLIGEYDASDQVLLVDLALRGSIVEIQDWLFVHREHDQRSVHAYKDRHSANEWFATRHKGRTTFPEWRLMREYLEVIRKAPLPLNERWKCFVRFLRWVKGRGRVKRLMDDVVVRFRGGPK